MDKYLNDLRNYLIKEQGYDEKVVAKMDYAKLVELYDFYTEDGA